MSDTAASEVEDQQVIAAPAAEAAWCREMASVLQAEIAKMDDAFRAIARSAVEDACGLATRAGLSEPASVNLSETGLLTLEWAGDGSHLMVVFSGDGEASVSTRTAESYYTTLTEFKTDNCPPELLENVYVIAGR